MYADQEDDPAINLKLKFDKFTPEFYTFVYLLTVLIVVSVIYLSILIIAFVCKKGIRIYERYIKRDDLTNEYLPIFQE